MCSLSRLSCCWLMLCLLTPLSAETLDWPQFRGPHGNATAEGSGYPVRFEPDGDRMLWSVELPTGVSSPCIFRERIFLTAYREADSELETICVDRGDGSILWRQAAPAEEIEKVHLSSSPANATPAADNEHVYVYFGSYGLLCYDHDGNQRWSLPLALPEMEQGSGSSPILVGELVILHRDQPSEPKLIAVNRNSGQVAWEHDYVFPPGLANESYSTPALYNDQLIIHAHAKVIAIAVKDGKELWSVSVPSNGCSSPCIAGQMAYVGAWTNGGETNLRTPLPSYADLVEENDSNADGFVTENEFSKELAFSLRPEVTDVGDSQIYLKQFFTMMDANKNDRLDKDEWSNILAFQKGAYAEEHGLLAIRLDSADQTLPRIAWAERKAVPEVPSPVYLDGRVYMIKNGGIATCLDAKTGDRHYRKRLGAAGSYYASPIAVENNIYAASLKGIVSVFAAGETLNVLAKNDLGEPIAATPAAVGGVLYVRTENHLYAFGEP